MDYSKRLKYHYQPEKGWLNDPNGLVYFKGYYHIFYQYAPNHQMPFLEPMCWGHARTKDFITFEELPIALAPDKPYDKDGCFSGTAIVKDDNEQDDMSEYVISDDVEVKITASIADKLEQAKLLAKQVRGIKESGTIKQNIQFSFEGNQMTLFDVA